MIPLDFGDWAASQVTGSLAAGIPLAMFAGLLSFFSPCVLPLLPGYLSYATGMSVADISRGEPGRRGRMLLGAVLFVFGFAIIFVITGALFGGFGSLLLKSARLVEIVAGVIAIILGLIFADLIPLGQQNLRPARVQSVGLAAAPLLGAAFAVGWTPCIGPTLGAVLTLALNEGSPGKGALLAFCYALGMGLPFVIAALAFTRFKIIVTWVSKRQRLVQRIGGGLLMLVGLLMIIGLWSKLIQSLQSLIASFGVPI